MIRRILNNLTHRLHEVPVLVLMPHSRCNCRCVMCDIWKANQTKTELSAEDLLQHVNAFQKLGVKHVALSGGEALMHRNLFVLCKELQRLRIHVSLLSTGLLLKTHARDIVTNCNEVIVSLDGPSHIHDAIRNIPAAYEKMQEGVRALRQESPAFRITGRSVIQKANYRALEETIDAALELQLDQISFLAADVSSTAFNRPDPWNAAQQDAVALSHEEALQLRQIIRKLTDTRNDLFDRRFVAESPQKLLRIPAYYEALAGKSSFPKVVCNAPWVSAVVESNGDILPCYFHPAYGN